MPLYGGIRQLTGDVTAGPGSGSQAATINLAITPTWTGAHAWTVSANTTALTSTTSNTGSNASSGVVINHTLNTSGSPDVFKIAVTDTARGASTKLFNLYGGAAGNSSLFNIDKDGSLLVAGNLSASTTSKVLTYAIGVFNNGGAGTLSLSGGGTIRLGPAGDDGTLALSNNALSITSHLNVPASGTLGLGKAASATPVNYILQGQPSRAGTDSNVAGATVTIQSGTGTGNSTPSTLALKSPVAVASGTGAQTQTTGLTINVGTAVLTNYTVANLPAAATAGAGATAFVTDANTTIILGLGLAVVGGGANKVPVYSDGTNWIIG